MTTRLAAALFAALLPLPAVAGERTIEFAVPGMYCASCPYIVEAAIGDVEGVLSVQADASQRTATVVYDDDVASVAAIQQASEAAGYKATPIEEQS